MTTSTACRNAALEETAKYLSERGVTWDPSGPSIEHIQGVG